MASFSEAQQSRSPRYSTKVTAAVLLVVLSTSPLLAQGSRDDAQLQILMVKVPGRDFDRRGQLMTLQINDPTGKPVESSQVVITARNATITDEEGRSLGAAITYYTNAQGRIDLRVRRNKAGVVVGLDVSASFLNRTGARSFYPQLPPTPMGLLLKVVTIAAIGAAGTAGTILASRTPPKPSPLPPTEIVVGVAGPPRP